MQPHLIGGGWELRFQTPHGLFKYIYIYIYFKCHSLEIVKSWMVGRLVGCSGLGHTILEVKKIACPLFHDLT